MKPFAGTGWRLGGDVETTMTNLLYRARLEQRLRRRLRRVKPYLLGTAMLCVANICNAQGLLQCGSLENAYGPFDYTNPVHFAERLPIVERAHFTPEVESFAGHNKCGGDGCQVAPDIDYTLRAFPNHHRALYAMVQYHLRGLDKSNRAMRYTPRCYFDRALRFKPDDSTVYMIYGYYLSKVGEKEEALRQYERALELAPNSAEAHYNAGLIYIEHGDYERARKHAKRAYELGFPLPGLRRKLETAGAWEEEKKQDAEPWQGNR